MKTALPALFTLLLLAVFAPHSSAQAEDLRMRFIPQWAPQAQFAGYYMAKEKGFFKDRHLDVSILRGGPDAPSSEILRKGMAEVGSMFLSGGLTMRAQGVPVVNIGQFVQRSALMLVARKSSGILSPIDFEGRTITAWPEFSLQPKALFGRYGLNVEILPQGYTLNLFLRGGVDAASAMWYNEYHTLLNSGVDASEFQAFFYADYGLNFPEDGLYVLEKTLTQHPEACRNFVLACVKGWEYAFEHPEEALDVVMRYVEEAKLPTNRVHQRWMLNRMRDIILPKGMDRPMGTLSEDDYNTVAKELKNGKFIESIPGFGNFYVNIIQP